MALAITPPVRRIRPVWRIRRIVGLVAVLLLMGFGLVGTDLATAAPAAAATSGCRAVGGGAVDTGGGPNRATVVVDTGSGTVWSACISFSGAISGIEALDRAAAHIADLHPVYDQYTGLGRAVCRLRGVGSDPPDCLGKSVSYWSYSHNGRVASVGAGAVTVRDGDVQGWRYGTGGTPRSASAGTEATSVPPPTTTTTRPVATTAPAPPTTRPPAGVVPPPSPAPGGSLTGSGDAGGTDATTGGAPAGGTDGPEAADGSNDAADDGTVSGEDEIDGVGSLGPGSDGVAGGDSDAGGSEVASANEDAPNIDGGGDEQAAAATGVGAGAASGSAGGGSSMGSALGFIAALGLVGAGALIVRRRRLAIGEAGADPTTAAHA